MLVLLISTDLFQGLWSISFSSHRLIEQRDILPSVIHAQDHHHFQQGNASK